MDLITNHAPVAGLLFFFIFFLGLLVWVFRPGSKPSYILKAQIPLKEDGPGERA